MKSLSSFLSQDGIALEELDLRAYFTSGFFFNDPIFKIFGRFFFLETKYTWHVGYLTHCKPQ